MPLTFDEYLPRLLDSSPPIVASDLRVLSSLKPAQSRALAKAWPRISLPRRRKLVGLMVELVEDNVELDYNDVFKIGLGDPDDEVRQRSAEGLWEDEDLSTAEALVHVVREDPAPAVRATAASSLGHFIAMLELEELEEDEGGSIKMALYEVVENKDEPLEVRRRAVESLGYLSEERSRAAIALAYADPSEKMRASALFAMGRSSDKRWLPAVLAELQSPEPEFRFEAARAAGELEDQRAVPLLIKLLDDVDRQVRLVAIDALGEIGGAEAKQALSKVIDGPDDEMAAAAEEAMEELEMFEDPLRFPRPDLGGL